MGPGVSGGLSASAGGGGPSGSSSNAGILNPFNIPFNFDQSGWVINMKSAGSTLEASGSKDANRSTQDLTSDRGLGAGLMGALSNQDMMPWLLAAAGLLLILRRK